MKSVNDLFIIKTGGDLWLEREISGDIPVVSLGFENNGIVGYIQKNIEHHLYPAGSITVSGWAGGMKAFVQVKDFYVRGRVKILIPKQEMTLNEKLYYCCCFNANAYRFAYGRKSSADRFSSIKIPALDDIPSWVNDKNVQSLISNNINNSPSEINYSNWKKYKISDIFIYKRGKGIVKEDSEMFPGKIPAIQGADNNNGVLCYLSKEFLSSGNYLYIKEPCITLARVGSSGSVNFQKDGCFIGDKAFALILKEQHSIYVYLYLKAILQLEKYKYTYGRGITINQYMNMNIMLPSIDNRPDWDYMEKYIKSLPYADKL